MSLINDALKKASQNAPQPQDDPAAPPYRPAVHDTPPRWPLFVIPPLVVAVLALGTMLLVRGWRGSRSAEPVVAQARETQGLPTPDKAIEPVAAQDAVPTNEAPSAAAVVTNPPIPTAANSSAPTFPNLKLQGVFWRPARPSVMINGKTLFVGDKLDKVKVVAISQESVTVQWNDEERILTLQ